MIPPPFVEAVFRQAHGDAVKTATLKEPSSTTVIR
jgi:hypothetical protein